MSKRVYTNLHKVAGSDQTGLKTTMVPESITKKSGAEALRYQ